MSRTPRTPSPTPSRSSTAPERSRLRRLLHASRWTSLSLFVGIACCSQGGGDLPSDMQADTPTERVRIFLIDREDDGVLGRGDGCGGSAVPVETSLPRRMPALGGALETLLDLRGDAEDPRSGLYNALHASPLEVETIERRGSELRVRLKGYLELGEKCDGERVLAQLTETALQFPDIQAVFFYLEDKPLREALTGK
jgi:hypothetical protein